MLRGDAGPYRTAANKMVTEAVPLENSFAGEQHDRYELKPEDLLAADQAARAGVST